MATAEALITNAQSYANAKDNDVATFINALADAANVFYENVIEEVLVAHAPLDVVTAMLDSIAGAFPEVPTLIVPGYSVPAVPDISFSTIEHDITTLEAARATLLSDLEDGGYGIDTGDEAQLLDRERDRIQTEAQTAVDEITRTISARGFTEPPGTLFGALERIAQGVREAISTASRNIYLQRAQQFVQARQFAIQSAGVADRTRADIMEIKFRIEEARARYTLALFQAELDQFKAQLAAALDKATLTVRIYEAQSAVVDARARMAAEKAKVFIGEYEANTRAFLGVMEVRLRNARNQLDAQVSSAEGRRDAAKAGASFYSQLVVSALGAVNTMVSQSSTDA